MAGTALTVGETIDKLHEALRDYVEATYHISHPILVTQRRRLLDEEGVIRQRPYIESTPRYQPGCRFAELGLDPAVMEMFAQVTEETTDGTCLIHDPPYQHQADSVRLSLVDRKSLLVMTGTGSGKTECFLLPILGRLAREANRNPNSFRESAVRCILLYPMNALVNDQLGRLRLLFGDDRIRQKFQHWGGRPARFARYTSRTLYPGVRNPGKDQDRLKPIGNYYVRYLELSADPATPEGRAAQRLVKELKKRGKWPAKPDLAEWYGRKGSRWIDERTGEFKRCVMMQGDPELLTRHEVLNNPPDIMVTNYSMLKYMLMRPLERPIFDATRKWLENNPEESILLVVDEAHLYRGAAGAEVGLLLRRLRTRLGIPADRLQVICTSASFSDEDYAATFAADLTGKHRTDFKTITGQLSLREAATPGSNTDAQALAAIDLHRFYEEETPDDQLKQISSFLTYRGVNRPWELQRSLYEALENFPPMSLLVNLTMESAWSVSSLPTAVFAEVDPALASQALTTLIALGSLARPKPNEPGLLPCRVHSFHRGLPGLWACM